VTQNSIERSQRDKTTHELEELRARIVTLQEELNEKTQTIDAIHAGEVDAIVVSTKNGDRIYTLKGAEEPYRLLFEQMSEGAVTISEDHEILYCNRSFARLINSPLEKSIGSNLDEYFSYENKKEFHSLLNKSMEGPTKGDLHLRAAGGSVIPIQLSVTRLIGDDFPTFCIVVNDLTERIMASDALRKANDALEQKVKERTKKLSDSEAKFRDVFETVQEVFYVDKLIFDQNGNVVDWIFEDLNPAGLRQLGFKNIEDVKGKRGSEILGEENVTFYIPMIEKAMRSNDAVMFQYRSPISGRDLLTSYVVRGDRLISAQMDITEMKIAQKAVEEERARLQKILDINPVGMFIGDKDGKCIYANEMFFRAWGIEDPSPLKLMDSNDIKGWIPDTELEVDQNVCPVVKAINGEESSIVMDIHRFDGTRGSIVLTGAPFRDSENKITGILVTIQDITSLRSTERELKRSNTELQHFAYIASHDLQEPLRMVISFLSLLESKYRDDLKPQAKEYIDHAIDGGMRMRALIDDILAYSRIETAASPKELVDMNLLVEKTLGIMQNSIKESGANITKDQLPTISCDESQMLQVLQNLLSNAIKFRRNEPLKIHISVKDGKDMWTFSVRDNGIGLNMEHAEKIFQMFQRLHTKDEYPGTGVGLAITRKIIERHGGKIRVESAEGNGATFFFTIPKN